MRARYLATKAAAALDAAFADLAAREAAGARLTFAERWEAGVAKFKEALAQPLTTVMYIAGPAMAPTLNPRAAGGAGDAGAREKLIIRRIARPGAPGSVRLADIVAVKSPLDPAGEQVMVRRLTALGGMEMVSDDPEDEPFRIPPGHCWLEADNRDLDPPAADSRAFGAPRAARMHARFFDGLAALPRCRIPLPACLPCPALSVTNPCPAAALLLRRPPALPHCY